MDRAPLGDLRQAFALGVVEIALDADVARNVVYEALCLVVTPLAVFRVYSIEIVRCGYRPQNDTLVRCVERERDACAHGERPKHSSKGWGPYRCRWPAWARPPATGAGRWRCSLAA